MRKFISLAALLLVVATASLKVTAQGFCSPDIQFFNDTAFMVDARPVLASTQNMVTFPVTYWTETKFDTTLAIEPGDTSANEYFDPNDPDWMLHTTVSYTVLGSPQTTYFIRTHGVDTFGNHYLSSFKAHKTGGIVSGVEDIKASELAVYPNPFLQNLNIQAEQRGVGILVDVSGRQVQEFLLEPGPNSLDTGTVPTGTYYLVIPSGQERKIAKVLKQ